MLDRKPAISISLWVSICDQLGVLARKFLNDCSKLISIASIDEHWTGNILDLYRFGRFSFHFGGSLCFRLLDRVVASKLIPLFHWYDREAEGGTGLLPSWCTFSSSYRLFWTIEKQGLRKRPNFEKHAWRWLTKFIVYIKTTYTQRRMVLKNNTLIILFLFVGSG